MRGFEKAAALLPPAIRRRAEELPTGEKRRCEEFRLRRGYPPTILAAGRERPLEGEPVTEDDIRIVAEAASRSSFHTAAEQLSRGYLSAAGGVRVGLCGTAVGGSRGSEGYRTLSSASIRVPRQVNGCADGVWGSVTAGGFRSLLILSEPGGGKTTLLRELIRKLSLAGLRVCVADERGEIAAMEDGGPGLDTGPCTDVITGMPKARAVMILLRTMNPQVIAMDEITEREDAEALMSAVGCGVRLLASVHGRTLSDLRRRRVCAELLERGAFERYVSVACIGGVRRYEAGELP